ncbi:M48 family metallopeptidase [Lutispora sp.]|jgi:predicted metal-dependent hydrolase|uniref:M48 family metallopeptidase n=1 Tax=Lutispora sp. TaxID=2828727 RepID=UPI003569D0CF
MKNIRIEDIEIQVIKKSIKNMYISVHKPDGWVRITAPKKMKDEDIWKFAVSKLGWIKKQRAKYQNLEIQPQKEYVTGEKHYFQGRAYLLNVIYTNKKQKVEIHNNQMDLYIREDSTREQREKVMIEWYRSKLKEEIPKLIDKWEQVMGVKVNSFGVKLMKTKWGTCNTAAKRIWINLELAKKNPKCLEYIVVHEMVHLLERYHNKRFYAFMDQYLPDWKEIREELKSIGSLA